MISSTLLPTFLASQGAVLSLRRPAAMAMSASSSLHEIRSVSVIQKDVDEARTGYFDLSDESVSGKGCHQLLGNCAGRFFEDLRGCPREVCLVVAEFFIGCRLEKEPLPVGKTGFKCQDRLPEELFES